MRSNFKKAGIALAIACSLGVSTQVFALVEEPALQVQDKAVSPEELVGSGYEQVVNISALPDAEETKALKAQIDAMNTEIELLNKQKELYDATSKHLEAELKVREAQAELKALDRQQEAQVKVEDVMQMTTDLKAEFSQQTAILGQQVAQLTQLVNELQTNQVSHDDIQMMIEDSYSMKKAEEEAASSLEAMVQQDDRVRLLSTIEFNGNKKALIDINGYKDKYTVDDELPDGSKIIEITNKEVQIENKNGRLVVLKVINPARMNSGGPAIVPPMGGMPMGDSGGNVYDPGAGYDPINFGKGIVPAKSVRQ